MNEQVPFAFSTTTRLLLGGLPLGVLHPQPEGQPVFKPVEWDEQNLRRLAEDIACLRSPVRAHALAIAELAAGEWGVTVRNIFSREKTREVADARLASAAVLHRLFPGLRDRVVAAAFERDRTWAAHAYNTTTALCESSQPFHEKFTRIEAAARSRFWPEGTVEPLPLTAP